MEDYKHLDKELSDFVQQFEKDLKDYIQKQGHYGKGGLTKSITPSIVNITDGYTLELSLAFFAQFLDKGKFLDNFLAEEQEKLNKIIIDSITKDLLNQFS